MTHNGHQPKQKPAPKDRFCRVNLRMTAKLSFSPTVFLRRQPKNPNRPAPLAKSGLKRCSSEDLHGTNIKTDCIERDDNEIGIVDVN